MPDQVARMAALFQAVADPNRMRLLKCLQVRPCCVCELVQATGMLQPRVSRHLRVLRDAGLVVDTRDAQWVEYSLARPEPGSAAAELLGLIAVWLEDAEQTRADRRRLAMASREQCVPVCASAQRRQPQKREARVV
jgi:ArsR family transcriptional regulator